METKVIEFEGNAIRILPFKMDNIQKDAGYLIIGKRGAGKSWLCQDIIKHINILSGLIFSPTEEFVPFYSNSFPESDINYKYDSALTFGLLQRQKDMIKEHVFLLMDDCLTSKKEWINDESFNTILLNGQSCQITRILTMQYPLGINHEFRSSFNYIFLFWDDNVDNQKRLYDYYAHVFPTFDIFQKVFASVTENYNCMVIDNTSKSDKIFWYKSAVP